MQSLARTDTGRVSIFSATEEKANGDTSIVFSSTDGLSHSFTSSQLTGYPASTVFLNVYDLHEATAFLAPIGCGLYHAGIEVYGREFFYGRHETENGIGENSPRVCPPHIFREQFVLGVTPLSLFHVEELFDELRSDPTWDGRRYQLVKHNCLHFAQCAAQRLLSPEHRLRQHAPTARTGSAQQVPLFVGTTSEMLVAGTEGPAATALSAQQMQLPALIPAHVDRLSRVASLFAPKVLVDWLDSWDRAERTPPPSVC